MRILFVLNTFAPTYVGGAEISVYHSCRSLMQSGLTCSILVVSNSRASASPREYYEYDGIPVHWPRISVGPRRWRDVFDGEIYRAVVEEIRRLRPDVVHVHNISGASLAPFLSCRATRVPVVQTIHDFGLLCPNNMRYQIDGTYCDPSRFQEPCRRCYRRYDYWADIPFRTSIFRMLASNVTLFVSPSRALVKQYVRAGYEEQRFRVVQHGVGPWKDAESDNLRVRGAIDASAGRPTILFAAAGFETKGPAVVLEALPILVRHIEGLHVIVAGGGEERFLGAFRRAGLDVLGHVPYESMPELLAAADLTIVPSIWFDNSPMVICESLRVGTPVVGSNVGGIPELVRELHTGYLTPVGDASALAEKIVFHFSRSPLDRRRMRRNCLLEARNHLSTENHVNALRRVYEEALGL
jgi:glycosyltransferase involved in cell wall biosynthesis